MVHFCLFLSLYKEKRINEQRKKDRELHLQTLKWQKEQYEKEAREAERKKLESLSIRNQIHEQIVQKEALKREKRKYFLNEGQKIKAALEAEKLQIEKIKQEKINLMKKKGIPEKYQTELTKKKVLQAKTT